MSRLQSSGIPEKNMAGFLADVLDHFSIGVVILDSRRDVLHVNNAAKRILDRCDGLELRDRQIRATDPAKQDELEQLIRQALRIQERWRKNCAGLLSVERERCARPLHLCVARVRSSVQPADPAVALLISDESASERQSVSLLRELYRLTPSESRLAAELLHGKLLDESAAALGISIFTARSHLKKIFEKTGTNRQSQLIWLLATGLGALDLDL